MTQKDKELLLKDLCARLPYGVIVQYRGHNTIIKNKLLTGSDLDCNMEYYKPYLRPMSSMTEDERKELWELLKKLGMASDTKRLDWLNKKMFDYRKDDEGKTMIDKGLALKAPEGMYNIK